MTDGAQGPRCSSSSPRVGKALANAKRLELLDLLAQGERSVESSPPRPGWG